MGCDSEENTDPNSTMRQRTRVLFMREKNRDRQKVFEIYGKTLNNRIMYK
jgi:hypothetical protein